MLTQMTMQAQFEPLPKISWEMFDKLPSYVERYGSFYEYCGRKDDVCNIQVNTQMYSWKRSEDNKTTMGSFEMFANEDHIELWNVNINSRYRGKGYGQQMIKEAVELANVIEIVLYVDNTNDVAIHVYKKCGFVVSDSSDEEQTAGIVKMIHPGEKLTINNRPDGICGYWGERAYIC